MTGPERPVPPVSKPNDPAGIAGIIDWLVVQGLRKAPAQQTLEGFSHRLIDLGLPLDRSRVAMQTLHPIVEASQYHWDAESAAERLEVVRNENAEEVWLRSPLRHMLVNDVTHLRRRLVGPDARLDFPVLEEFRDEGFTDFYGRLYGFVSPQPPHDRVSGAISRWMTRRDRGFDPEDMALIDRLLPHLTLAMQASQDREIAINLLDAYVGPVAGRRILSGEIYLGTAESIDAVLMIADLSGFTVVSDATPPAEMVAVLNRFFDAMVGPVLDNGGQVLKYLGDGFLAIFPIRPGEEASGARAALAASEAALASTEALNAERRAAGDRTMALTVALHAGAVMFGNVGARARLDFTVIGPAVNEASRMEALCKELGLPLLASDRVARLIGTQRMKPAGEHVLRGVTGTRTLHTLKTSLKRA